MNYLNSTPQKHIAVMGIKGLPAKGGGERVAEAIINKALKNNFKVSVYAKKSYFENIDIPDNLEIILIKDLKGKRLNAFSFGLFSALHALFFGSYDLIHLHYADFGYIVPILKLRYKVIGTSHGAEYHRDKWDKLAKLCFKIFEAPFVRYSDICTSVSKPLAEYYGKKYGKKIHYIPNGIYLNNTLHDVNGATLKKYNIPSQQYILFCAGRIIPSKGCDLLLQANRNLKLEVPLVIIGDLSDSKAYKDYLMDLAEPNVVFIDFISSKEELFEIIAQCRFFVFPSTYEAMSMMLLEVASLKKGIVCSDLEENFEAIGENAIYFKSGEVDSLTEKIRNALENQDKMEELGGRAFHWVTQNRNWEGITESYLTLYKEF